MAHVYIQFNILQNKLKYRFWKSIAIATGHVAAQAWDSYTHYWDSGEIVEVDGRKNDSLSHYLSIEHAIFSIDFSICHSTARVLIGKDRNKTFTFS